MTFYNTTTNWFTSIIITHTYLVWPFTIPQQTDLHKYKYNTDLLSMAFYNTRTNWFTNIIITNTYLVWPFTILQLTDLQT